MRSTFTAFSFVTMILSAAIGCAQPVAEDEDVAESADEIVGGREAKPGAWAGTAAIYYGNQQGCGGSLVADSWVLTAAHCIDPRSPTGGISKVVIGRHRLSSNEGEAHTVDRVIAHEAFDDNLDNDIALVHLRTPSQQAKVQLLGSPREAPLRGGQFVTVVGWGDRSEGGFASDVLRQVSVPIVANAKCATYEAYETITENMLCAGLTRGTKDACQGDSGGPLFFTQDGRNVQVGLVSWGIGCARERAPGVYTRVGNYAAWLREKSNGEIGAN